MQLLHIPNINKTNLTKKIKLSKILAVNILLTSPDLVYRTGVRCLVTFLLSM